MPRKRKHTRHMKGKGLKEVLGKIHDFVKNNKLISRGLTAVTPFAGSFAPLVGGVGAAAHLAGYGKHTNELSLADMDKQIAQLQKAEEKRLVKKVKQEKKFDKLQEQHKKALAPKKPRRPRRTRQFFKNCRCSC